MCDVHRSLLLDGYAYANNPSFRDLPTVAVSTTTSADETPRAGNRSRVLKSAMISFSGGQATLECVVRDYSATGARLRLQGLGGPPDTFELLIELDGIKVDCEVTWRRGQDCGVKFISPIQRVVPQRKQVVSAPTDPNAKISLRRVPRGTK